MSEYNMVMESEVSTVLAEYKPEKRKHKEYQSEAELEQELINNLQEQGYEYLRIHNTHDLEDNLRVQLEKLNESFSFRMRNGEDFSVRRLWGILRE